MRTAPSFQACAGDGTELATTRPVTRLVLPPGTALARQSIDAGPVRPTDLPPALARTAAKRQREFLAGRACARRALRQAGFAGADPPLACRPNGAPAWPAGWLGSISHTDQQAVGVAAPMVCCRVLGFDREPVLGAATAQEILPFLAASGELEPLLAVANLAVATTILFSAKESLFKALSGALGDFADFTAARLVGCIPGGIQLRLSIDWGDAWPAGTVLPIQVAREADAVETLLHVRP